VPAEFFYVVLPVRDFFPGEKVTLPLCRRLTPYKIIIP
jgi:hypothetical protein